MAITLQQFMATILINYNGVIGWSTTSMRLKLEEEVRETKKNTSRGKKRKKHWGRGWGGGKHLKSVIQFHSANKINNYNEG